MAKTENIVEYRGRTIKSLRKSFNTACRRAGIPYSCEMYHVRHLFGSVMLAGGADLASVSALLGHGSISTTVNHYIHVMEGAKKAAIGLLPSLSTIDEAIPEKVIKMQARK